MWANAVVQGVLLGGVYALFATGLSLAFGIMRLANLAHGALALLAAFGAYTVVDVTGLNPLVATVVVVVDGGTPLDCSPSIPSVWPSRDPNATN